MSDDIETQQQAQKSLEEEKIETNFDKSQEEGRGTEEVKVAQDQELQVLPGNEEEDKEEILITDATKRPSPNTKSTSMNKKQQRARVGRKQGLPYDMTRLFKKQNVEITKMGLLLRSIQKQIAPLKIQSNLMKQLQSQLRQIQKQMSQIEKGIITKEQRNKLKRKTIRRT
jgi:hypothetical protein